MLNPATISEVKERTISFPNNSYDLDPLPTWLMKKCIATLLQPVTAIINRSLAEGAMPCSLKG